MIHTLNDSDSPSRTGWPRLMLGVLALVTVVAIATHLGEGRKLLSLLAEVRPLALLLAAVVQCGTYICVATMLRSSLAQDGARLPLRQLCPLVLAKQFVSQAVPSVGVSGNLMVIRGLEQRGVARVAAVRAVLVSLSSYCLAFAIALIATIVILWRLRDVTPASLMALTMLLILMWTASLSIFWLGAHTPAAFPARARRWLIAHDLEELLSESSNSRWSIRLLSIATALQFAVFLLDATTLYVVLAAIGVRVAPAVVFAALVSAQAVASIGIVPGGLGAFEGTCVALLHAHGVAIEAALAGTVILRGFTFWLPILPGLWVSRSEVVVNHGDKDVTRPSSVEAVGGARHSRREPDGSTT